LIRSIAFSRICHCYEIGCEFAAFIVTVQSTGVRGANFGQDAIEKFNKRRAFTLACEPVERQADFIIGELELVHAHNIGTAIVLRKALLQAD
jgi:hypothetical protein